MTPFGRILRHLKERNVRKTMAIYVSAALTTIGVVKLFTEVYDIPPLILTVVVTVLTIGAGNALVYSWQKGTTPTKRGRTISRSFHSVFLVLAVILAYRAVATMKPGPPDASPASVVAVLPFSNLNANADDEYFSDGITEDILTHLSKIADLRVISRTSVMRYKNTTKPIREIAAELGAGSILEGSVRRSGNRIRIVGQLIDAGTDVHLWSETYDRELTDVFAIQSDVAQQIARALRATLSPAEITLIGHRPTGNVDAYTLYLRGRDLYYRFTNEENESAISLFKQAIGIDPNYALAYSGLADAYAQRVQRFAFDAQWADSAIEASHAAIRLDPRIAEPYKSLGLAYAQREWYHKALDQFAMALRISPNFSAAVSNLGLIHLWTGDPASALPLIRKALILSPERTIHNFHLASVYDAVGVDSLSEQYYRKTIALDGTSTFAYRALAQLYVVTRRVSEARAMLDTVLRENSEDSYLLIGAGEVELFDGNLERAEEFYKRATSVLAGTFAPTTQLGYILLKRGKDAEGNRLLRESLAITARALADGSENYDHMMDQARVYAIQGDTSKALSSLENAIRAGWMLERLLAIDPQLEHLRNSSRFQKLLADLRARIAEIRQSLAKTDMLN